jgi:hypothetical protein
MKKRWFSKAYDENDVEKQATKIVKNKMDLACILEKNTKNHNANKK